MHRCPATFVWVAFPFCLSLFSSAQETCLWYAAALNPCAGFWQEFTGNFLFWNLISGKPGSQACRFPTRWLCFLPMSREHNPWEPWLCFQYCFVYLASVSQYCNLLPFLGLRKDVCNSACCLIHRKQYCWGRERCKGRVGILVSCTGLKGAVCVQWLREKWGFSKPQVSASVSVQGTCCAKVIPWAGSSTKTVSLTRLRYVNPTIDVGNRESLCPVLMFRWDPS